MSNQPGDTLPPENKPGETPPAGGNTPPQSGGSSPSDEHKNELERERARAATALQQKEEAEKRARDERIARIRAEKALKAAQGDGAGDGGNGGQAPSGNEDAEEEIIRANAEKQVYALVASTQSYQELLAKDPTLKEVLLRNPLSLISEYIDAEDAADQVKKYLDSRLQAGSGTPPSSAPGGAGTPPPQNPPKPGSGGGDNNPPMRYSAEQIRNMRPEDWLKIPKEQRAKMMQGDFS